MARSRISSSGKRVIISLNFDEAAALEALLARVGVDTDPEIADGTFSLWDQLAELRDMVTIQTPDLWPDTYDGFRCDGMMLMQPKADID